MECNVGKEDKVIRVLIGVITLYLGYTMNPLFYIIAGIALVTAATGVCPAYSLLKVSTCKAHPSKPKEE